MSNTGEFYDHLTYPVTRSTGSSASMRAELDQIEAGFNKLPPLAGNGLRLVKIGTASSDMTVSGVYETAGGQLLYGTSAARTIYGSAPGLQLEASGAGSRLSLWRNSADAGGPVLVLGKSRGAVAGSSTIVQSGDVLGELAFIGADGVDAETPGALIRAEVDGTPGANDLPTRIVFLTTADGAATPTDRGRIDNLGRWGLGTGSLTLTHRLHVDAPGVVGLALGQRISAIGNGGIGRGISLTMAAPGSGTAVDVVSFDALHEAATATATAGALSIKIADTAGVLQQRMRFTAAGLVSIGADTVVAPVHLAVPLSAGAVADVALFSQNSTVNPTTGQGVRVHWSASGSITRSAAIEAAVSSGINGHHLAFMTNLNGASATERARIDVSGNVGIGMTPVHRLDVTHSQNGGSRIQLLNADVGGGADARIVATNGASEIGLIMRGTGFTAASGNGLLYVTNANPLVFSINGAERTRILPTGQILHGDTVSRPAVVFGGALDHSIQANNTAGGGFSTARFSVGAAAANAITFAKSRGTTLGDMAATGSGDTLGYLAWAASDGASFQETARIVAQVDGAVAAGDTPGRLVLYTTPAGSAAPVERMRITNAGLVGLGITPAVKLHIAVAGTGNATSIRFGNDTDAGYGQIQYIGSTFATTVRQKLLELVTGDAASAIAFRSGGGGAENLRIDPAGVVLKGNTASVTSRLGITGITPPVQVTGVTGSTASMLVARYSADVTAAYIHLAKSRGAIGAHAVVVNGDLLGATSFVGSDGTNFTEASRVAGYVDGTPAADVMPGGVVVSVNAGSAALTDVFKFTAGRDAVHISSVGALGYGAGAGGAVTQLIDKGNTVVLNRASGQITMNAAALAASGVIGFQLTNSVIGANDVVVPCIKSGGTFGAYTVTVASVSAGSCLIYLRNLTAGSLSEAVVLQFAVIRGAIA